MRYLRVVFVVIMLVGCASSEATTSPAPLPSPPTKEEETQPPPAAPSATPADTSPPPDTPVSTPASTPSAELLPRPLVDFDTRLDEPFGATALTQWESSTYAGQDYTLPVALDGITNPEVITGLTGTQQAFLSEQGFVVMHSQEPQFSAIQDSVTEYGQPYFITTDLALHALHITFDDLLKALEREYLRPRMAQIVDATYREVLTYLPATQGGPLEEDVTLSAAYLGVALKLFDPNASLDPSLEPLVNPQIEQIMAYGGKGYSTLFPKFEDDYGAYRPVGHYAGDEGLEQYFRGMTWLGRMHFALKDESRLPLIVTIALRRAPIGDSWPAVNAWDDVHEVLTFVIGPTDDAGPPEYAALMDQIYGNEPHPLDLADEGLWTAFNDLARDELAPPRINSTFVDWLEDLPDETGWRFMGQRFTIDGYIMQNLVYNAVEEGANGQRRQLPTGPDVMAVFGSPVALDAVQMTGMADYPNYYDQVGMLQEAVAAQPQEEWLLRFYDMWLYAFFPILHPKGDEVPTYMRTSAWATREMNSALGSWAELKHDTILYTKMPEGAGGGGPPISGPPPGYVEANPDAFYRMAYAARMFFEGFDQRGVHTLVSPPPGAVSFDGALWHMSRLADYFEDFGDIAARELAGEPLTEDDYSRIAYNCLFMAECTPLPGVELDPPPVVAAVAGDGYDSVLEAGIGNIDRMYVIVPIDGQMVVAQGGVFSYYEFIRPRTDRLTDQAWRELLDGPDAPAMPVWSSAFVFEGGQPTQWLAFRIGDIYYTIDNAINLRESPSLDSPVLAQLDENAYFGIIEGPVSADGYTWWKVEIYFGSDVQFGWLVEHQDWYRRSNPS